LGFESYDVTLQRLCAVISRKDLAQAGATLKLRPELAKLSLPGGTALHFAGFGRSPEMVRLLQEHGADANQSLWPQRDAATPFVMAVR